MAIFRLQISSIGRTGGRTATAAAAYRAGERIRDERSGEIHNHSRRKDVTHAEIILPAHLSGPGADWARDRGGLWNTVERAETRKDARVARELQVNLPAELSTEQRLQLARIFSQEVADRYNIAVDLAIHDPRPGGDPRNFHAHLLATTREVTAGGLGSKAGLDMNSDTRRRLGLPSGSQEYSAIRERWATLTNEALREAKIDARVDHRSLEAQGIDREPRPHIPFAAYQMDQNGERSDVAERLRKEYSLRVEARVQARLGRAVESNSAESRSALPGQRGGQPVETPVGPPRSLEDIRREAREAWMRMRAAQSGSPHKPSSQEQAPTREQSREGARAHEDLVGHEPDDDYSP